MVDLHDQRTASEHSRKHADAPLRANGHFTAPFALNRPPFVLSPVEARTTRADLVFLSHARKALKSALWRRNRR
ncbi:MAG TPA: hypothetical protein VJ834_15140, partial [Burkholderiales bacterium]|nr:hypothetical protein [Burkholderiales bacterium]